MPCCITAAHFNLSVKLHFDRGIVDGVLMRPHTAESLFSAGSSQQQRKPSSTGSGVLTGSARRASKVHHRNPRRFEGIGDVASITDTDASDTNETVSP